MKKNFLIVGCALLILFVVSCFYFYQIFLSKDLAHEGIEPQTNTSIQIPNPNLKVFSLAYYPIKDGKLDTQNAIQDTYGEYPFTLAEVRERVEFLTNGVIAALNEGSHGELRYEVIDHQEVSESIPLSGKKHNDLPLPDYLKIMQQINICDLVDKQEVREIWIWSYAGTGKSGWESNFASKKYGDISNSDSDPNDLPVCKHSYTVYDYNYGRGVAEAVHDHTHQMEAIFGSLNADFFWGKFVGDPKEEPTKCGWTHIPPNGDKDYDYANPTPKLSVCDELFEPKPQSKPIACQEWNCDHLGFLVWWMKHIPATNKDTERFDPMSSNWWEFIVDFDRAMEQGKKLR